MIGIQHKTAEKIDFLEQYVLFLKDTDTRTEPMLSIDFDVTDWSNAPINFLSQLPHGITKTSMFVCVFRFFSRRIHCVNHRKRIADGFVAH